MHDAPTPADAVKTAGPTKGPKIARFGQNGSGNRQFTVVLAGQFLSKLSTTASQLAIIWHLALNSHSSLLLAAAAIAAFMPQALLGPFAGTFVDRLAKKKVLIASDLGVAALALTVVIVGQLTTLASAVLLVILALRSLGEAFHTPALQAAIPLFIPAEKLVNSAGFLQMVQAMPLLLGPSLAALLLGFLPYHLVVGIDVVGAVAAVLLLVPLTFPNDFGHQGTKAAFDSTSVVGANSDTAPAAAATNDTAPAAAATNDTAPAAVAPYLDELRAGLRVLRQQRGLFALTLFSPVFLLVLVATKPLFPLMAFDYFGGTTWHAGLIETGFAFGVALGGLAIGISGGLRNRVHSIVLACLLVGVCQLVAGLLPPEGFVVFVALFAVAGVSNALFTSTINALYQQLIPVEFLGRVFATVTSLMLLAMPLGLAWGGAVAALTGPTTVFVLCGALMMVLGLTVWAPRRIRQLGQTTRREKLRRER